MLRNRDFLYQEIPIFMLCDTWSYRDGRHIIISPPCGRVHVARAVSKHSRWAVTRIYYANPARIRLLGWAIHGGERDVGQLFMCLDGDLHAEIGTGA